MSLFIFAADETVKIWDLVANQPTHTLTPHSGKVQSVRWRPVDASVLLSGGFDMNIFLVRSFQQHDFWDPSI